MLERDTLTFISWNVNGIRAVEKKEALKWVDEEEVDFLGLQEIKAEADQIPDSIFEREYKFQSINSSSNKGQSGVALYTDVKGEASCCSHVDILDEGRINEYHFGDIALFNVYFPNGQRDDTRLAYKMAFYDRFLEHILEVRKQGKSIVVCGDVNTAHQDIDLARPRQNQKTTGFLPEERAWVDEVVSQGYVDSFRALFPDLSGAYSWWSYIGGARGRNVGWRLDYFFVSEDMRSQIADAAIHADVSGSDHCPVSLTLQTS